MSAGPAQPIRLVAFDVDGTLVGRDLTISDRVKDAVAKMRESGVAGCLVTGRMYRATVPFARTLHLDSPLICYQGAAIVDPATDEVLAHSALANELVRELIGLTERDAMHLQLYRNDEYYCEARNRFSELYASLSLTEPVIVPSLREAFAYQSGNQSSDRRPTPRRRASTNAACKSILPIARTLRAACRSSSKCSIRASIKAARCALSPVASASPIEATLAIGDSWNDAPLLRAAGFAVAMGSGPPELREIADAVVGDVAHDGVAEAIERYVLT